MPIHSFRNHTEITGEHIWKQDIKARELKVNRWVRNLAKNYGKHSGNVNRRMSAYAVLGLVEVITAANIYVNSRPVPDNTAGKRINSSGMDGSNNMGAGTALIKNGAGLPVNKIKNTKDAGGALKQTISTPAFDELLAANKNVISTAAQRASGVKKSNAGITTKSFKKPGNNFQKRASGINKKRVERSLDNKETVSSAETTKPLSTALTENGEKSRASGAEVTAHIKPGVAETPSNGTITAVPPPPGAISGTEQPKNKNKNIVIRLEEYLSARNSGEQVKGKEALLAEIAELLLTGQQKAIHLDRRPHLRGIASVIMQDERGYVDETLKTAMAKEYVRDWLIREILGGTPALYMAQLLEESRKTSTVLMVTNLLDALSLKHIKSNGKIDFKLLTAKQRTSLEKFWQDVTGKELAFLYEYKNDSEILKLPLHSIDFFILHAGLRYIINTGGNVRLHSKEQLFELGIKLLNRATGSAVNSDAIDFFFMPALFYRQYVAPGILRTENGDTGFEEKIEIVSSYIDLWKEISEQREEMSRKFENYSRSRQAWLPKVALAAEYVASCEKNKTGRKPRFVDAFLPDYKYIQKQNYIDGVNKPCADAADSLDEEYKRRTFMLAEDYSLLLEGSIKSALGYSPEAEFIFNKDNKLRPVEITIHIKHEKPVATPEGLLYPITMNEKVGLNQFVVAFSVKTPEGEERIYALSHQDDNTFQLQRTDRAGEEYVKLDILGGDKNIVHNWLRDGEINGVTVDYAVEEYSTGQSEDSIAVDERLRILFREKVYAYFHKLGESKSSLQHLIELGKDIVPFYRFVEAVMEGDKSEAVSEFLLEIAGIVPGIKGGIKGSYRFSRSLIKQIKKLPDVKSAVKIIKKTGDTGWDKLTEFEKSADIFIRHNEAMIESRLPLSKTYEEKLRLYVNQKNAELEEKLYAVAHFAGEEESPVVVRKIYQFDQEEIYVLVNPDTERLFGKKYTLTRSDSLIPYTEPSGGCLLKTRVRRALPKKAGEDSSLKYEKNCVAMTLSKIFKTGVNDTIAKLMENGWIKSGRDLENESIILIVMEKLGMKKAFDNQQWGYVHRKLKTMPDGRYFAVNSGKHNFGEGNGHAFTVIVKNGSVGVAGNNAETVEMQYNRAIRNSDKIMVWGPFQDKFNFNAPRH